jgi:hypothetical protein
VPSRYELVENDSRDYSVRTRQNVIDSDATLILYERRLSGGTLLTKRLAGEAKRPCLCVPIDNESAEAIKLWLSEIKPGVLNVAGPRESSAPGIEARALQVLLRVFETPSS